MVTTVVEAVLDWVVISVAAIVEVAVSGLVVDSVEAIVVEVVLKNKKVSDFFFSFFLQKASLDAKC
jgi:hypothetical protein